MSRHTLRTESTPISDRDDDRPMPSELEQLARSLSLDGNVGRRDALVIAEQLRRLARLDRESSLRETI